MQGPTSPQHEDVHYERRSLMIPGLPTVGPMELIILMSIVLLFFGARRIPDLARSLGKGTREFRKGITEPAAEDETQENRKKEDAEKPPVDEATAEDESPRPKETEVTHAEQKS